MCQLDALRVCRRPSAIKRALEVLPETLYDTYDRILESIDDTDIDDARAILQWLAFSKRPLTLEEIAEAATMRIGTQSVDPDDRLYDPYDVPRICRTLVSLATEEVTICGKLEVHKSVRFAHASVQEYLLSEHIAQGPAAGFAIAEKEANETIGRNCLIVLLQNEERHAVPPDTRSMPLLRYAAEFWFEHARTWGRIIGTQSCEDLVLENLVNRLFQTSITTFQNWLTIYDPNIKRGSSNVRGSGPSPLYYAALLGFVEPIKQLLRLDYDINALGGKYGTALVAASSNSHEVVARVLVEKGADVNCYGGSVFGSPLEAACYSGCEPIIHLLIQKGADVNSQRKNHDTALQRVCQFGHESQVLLLLESGANVNAYGGGYGYALAAASERGHFAIVDLLLKHGANVNARGGQYGSVLQAAASRGFESIVQLLLDSGAHPNAQGGGFRDALRATAVRRHVTVFHMLLKSGADPDLSVRQLREQGGDTDGLRDKALAEQVHNAWTEGDESLFSLMNVAAMRIVDLEQVNRRTARLRSKEYRQPNYSRIKKMKEFVMTQNANRYQEATIPTTWLVTRRSS